MSSNEDSDNDVSQATTSGRKKKEYSVKFKLHVVEWAKLNRNNNGEPNKHAAAKHFGVPRQNIRRWIHQAGLLQVRKGRKGGNQAKNLPGGGRPVKNKEFELQLNDCVSEGRAGKYKVTRDLIAARARQLQETLPQEHRLNLSHEWLESFMRRNKWTLRAPTSVAQKPPADYQDRVVKFVVAVEAMRKQYMFKQQHIYGADETGVWLNPAGGLCVEQIDRKDVTVLSAGNTKLRITVMLTARSDGKREKPFVLMPFGPKARCKKEVDKKFPNKLHLIWMDTTWMNNPITAIYLQKVFGGFFKPQRLLVWDQFSAHKSADTKTVLKQLKLETVLVPAGCTRFVQPADVSWNAPFKRKLRSLYDQWMLEGDHETTAAGNPKPPSPEVYLQWVLDAWEPVKTDVIVRSFKACGINNALDGSEDALIHCLKEGNGMPDGVASLVQTRQNAAAQDLPELMQGLEVEAAEDPEDDAGNDSDASVISAGDQAAEESEEVEVEDSDSDF